MSMSDAAVADRLELVRRRILDATREAGRAPGSVALLAVSKRQGAAAIRAAFAAGQRAFGESYVQEALDKQAALEYLPIEWHFIGRIQTNKTRQIASHFDWIHGLADADHARRLSEQRPAGRAPLQVCLQVNLSGEASKGGVAPDAVAGLLAVCAGLPGLQVQGLMTLPAPCADLARQREPFRALRRLRDRLATSERPLSCLSMGMSDDLEAAILEGATLVRIGTAVFGPRPYNGGRPVEGPAPHSHSNRHAQSLLPMNTPGIAFLGGGNMATSLIAGLIADGFPPASICVSEPDPARREGLVSRFGVRAVADNRETLALAQTQAQATTLVLCVKPQIAPIVCREIADLVSAAGPLVISIMAGVPEAAIQRWLGSPAPVVRSMPNTPAMVQSGAIGLHASPEVGADGRNRAETILRAAGLTRWVEDEGQIDAVTALSGSGPAYFFLLMEALEQAGIDLGLDAETSRLLTIQTALGAARMAMESTSPPARLREQVTSPGGTTERALAVFEAAGLRALVGRATLAARDRAAEISKTLLEQS